MFEPSSDTLTALSRKTTQELVHRSINAHIAEGFIRPYAIVQTPSFIGRHANTNSARNSGGAGARRATDVPRGGVTTLFSGIILESVMQRNMAAASLPAEDTRPVLWEWR